MQRFKYAYQGFIALIKKDFKFLLHCFFGLIVIFFGFVFHITQTEWLFLILSIGLVMSFEAINTAVEYVVDLATDEYHLFAKHAKDIAATSVLIVSIIAAIIGLIIFIPYIL